MALHQQISRTLEDSSLSISWEVQGILVSSSSSIHRSSANQMLLISIRFRISYSRGIRISHPTFNQLANSTFGSGACPCRCPA